MSGDLITSETVGSEPCLSFLPVMVTRLMLSLKKAATSQDNGWSLGESTTHSTTRFAERRGGVFTRDEIRLDTFVSTYEEIQSREW